MAKKKTSKKQGFSSSDMETTKLPKKHGLKTHDPKKSLRKTDDVFEALLLALQDNDPETFKEILSAHLSVINKDQFTKKAQISRRTLFRMLSPEGNPTLDNLARVFHALKAA